MLTSSEALVFPSASVAVIPRVKLLGAVSKSFDAAAAPAVVSVSVPSVAIANQLLASPETMA